jgi:hypothetical protein
MAGASLLQGDNILGGGAVLLGQVAEGRKHNRKGQSSCLLFLPVIIPLIIIFTCIIPPLIIYHPSLLFLTSIIPLYIWSLSQVSFFLLSLPRQPLDYYPYIIPASKSPPFIPIFSNISPLCDLSD